MKCDFSNGFCKNFEQNQIQFHSKFLQNPLDISTSDFYWMIERSKPQGNVLLIFCDSTYLFLISFKLCQLLIR